MPRSSRLPLSPRPNAKSAPALNEIVDSKPARLKTAVQLLRLSVDDLYAAASNCELDRKSHGPNIKKNSVTFANHIKLEALYHEVIQLLRDARAAVASHPTPASQRKLIECERMLCAWIDSFEPGFDPPSRTTH